MWRMIATPMGLFFFEAVVHHIPHNGPNQKISIRHFSHFSLRRQLANFA
jgi:hypothetical protein